MPELLLLEGEDLPELMTRVRDELGPRATIVRAERVRHGGVAGFFSREHYELTVEVPDRPRAVAPSLDPLEALMDAADRAEAGPRGVPEPPVSTAGARFAAVLEGVWALAGDEQARSVPENRTEGALAAAPAVTPSPAVAPAPAVVVPGPPRPEPSWGRAAMALLSAGVPPDMLDRAGSVADVLERIPDAPAAPREPGRLLVVVGPREAATATADLLRLRWQLPADAVVEAGDGGLTSSAAVVRWRVRSGQAPHPWVLVVPVADDPTGRVQAAALVAAAQPDAVWAVVDARTKPADAARWLEQVGGARRPDALAVLGLLDTGDPGSVLGLGLPVAWADGIPASRALWATVLGQPVDAALRRRA